MISSIIRRWRAAWRLDRTVLERSTRNFSYGFGGSMASIAIGFGRTALLTKAMTLVDYGRLLIVINLPAFVGAFLRVRVNDLINKFYPEFEEAGDTAALRGLILLSVGINLAISVIVGAGIFVLAEWIARTFYADQSIATLFRIYAVVKVLSFLHGVYTPILRLKDRFAAVIVPQVVTNLLVLAALGAHFWSTDGYELSVVVTILAAGVVAAMLYPLAIAVRLVLPILREHAGTAFLAPLRAYRSTIFSTAFQTNLAGYLRFIFAPGDVFVLGVFGTPTQVAIYGLAQQLTAPLLVLETNVAAALTPEVVTLWARRKLDQLDRLLRYYVVPMIIFGAGAILLGVLLARPVVLWLSKPEYLASIPVFTLLLFVSWISISFLLFYPLGLSLNQLRWFNIANVVNIGILATVILVKGELTALSMAAVLVVAAVIRRAIGNLPVYVAFRRARRSMRAEAT